MGKICFRFFISNDEHVLKIHNQAINYSLPVEGRYSENWKNVLELNLSIKTSKKKLLT